MADVVKKVTATKVQYALMVEDTETGGLQIQERVQYLSGTILPDRAKRMMRKALGEDATFKITDVSTATHTYRMTLNDFIQHAEIADGTDDAEEVEDDEQPDGAADAANADATKETADAAATE